MNRSRPLRRYTPPKSGGSLRRTVAIRPTGRLRPRSPRMAAVYRTERVPLVQAILAEHPWCGLALPGCTGPATTVHELLPRGRGGSITDPDNCVSACASCNRGASQEHITEAQARGLLLHSWQRPRSCPEPEGAA